MYIYLVNIAHVLVYGTFSHIACVYLTFSYSLCIPYLFHIACVYLTFSYCLCIHYLASVSSFLSYVYDSSSCRQLKHSSPSRCEVDWQLPTERNKFNCYDKSGWIFNDIYLLNNVSFSVVVIYMEYCLPVSENLNI